MESGQIVAIVPTASTENGTWGNVFCLTLYSQYLRATAPASANCRSVHHFRCLFHGGGKTKDAEPGELQASRTAPTSVANTALTKNPGGLGKYPRRKLLSVVLTKDSLNLKDSSKPGPQSVFHKYECNGKMTFPVGHMTSVRNLSETPLLAAPDTGCSLSHPDACIIHVTIPFLSVSPPQHGARRARTTLLVY